MGPAGIYIPAHEYYANFDDRAKGAELQPGFRYALNSIFLPNRMNIEAFKRPVLMQEVEHIGGIAVVKFLVETSKIVGPSQKLNPPPKDSKHSGRVDDGVLESRNYGVPSFTTKQMYFSFDLSDMDDDLSTLFESLMLPA